MQCNYLLIGIFSDIVALLVQQKQIEHTQLHNDYYFKIEIKRHITVVKLIFSMSWLSKVATSC